ncbi:YccS family putative transporter [Actinobacillus pleuropneumoniae]|uniref:Integral membrane protein n=1 Tax=Actinobacillus pleuropneumoniae TaxID=715 RepID=A0A448U0P2_ACTPL|nr:YccS family putative transporter [Actinobacillus pleuropneumoniae]EFM87149.1 Predicted membrane protein [Actinobacillus pleuropneumoniae serovar 2 str. S1536]MBT9319982.1 TIGR01666 family membrane protein [Actinobacillus pleuropneumoniae]MBT9344856.1 TIGR01666 family membrane protein [Actinobacillus pleuropneumoniae]MEE3619860.1 YccS family putative transporter [Actinobacillus pleuropneumoniae]UKH07994.1 TIGR01666 family membrane protein [Actinobacillus pleuropneumoniae]
MKNFLKTFRFDWLSENMIKTLPIFISINLVSLVVWQLQMSHLAMSLILGVIAGGLVDLDNSPTGRIKNLVLSLLAFAVSSLGAQFSLSFGWLFLPAAMLSTFILVMLGAIGQRYSTIAFGSLIVAVYTSLVYTPESIWYGNMLMILSGALIYGVVALIVHLCFPNRIVQENLAKAYDALGAYLQAKSEYFDPDDDDLAAKQLALAKANQQIIQTFDQTRISLFYRLQGRNRHSRTHHLLRYYFTAQDIWERASSSHYQYHELFQQLNNSDLMFRFQRVMELQAIACQRVASALRHGESYQHSARGEKALQGLLNSLHFHSERGLKSAHRWQSIAENLRNIEGQLNQIEQENGVDDLRKDVVKSTRLIAENVSGLRNMLNAIRSQCTLSSQLFRHAIRLSIVVFACSLVVQLLNLDGKGYWILLTAVFVCQPNYAATKKRLVQRIIGTVLGVFVGFLFQYFAPSLEAQLGLISITGSLYYFFRISNYGFSTFFITLLVFVSLDVSGLGAENALLPRLFDTLIGTALAWFAVSFIYPDWKYLNLHRNLQSTLVASGQYLRHILAQLQFGYNDQLAYRVARRDVHNNISALSAVISNMHGEPKKYREVLDFAPKLLGVTYTLLGYISALGSYRVESSELSHNIDFSAIFFSKGKQVVDILDAITQMKDSESVPLQLSEIDTALNHFEQTYQDGGDKLALVLVQQLRMITQLLPQLQRLVNKEQLYRE